MFQFRRFPSAYYLFHMRIQWYDSLWIAPFGYLWIIICLRFPTAFRSLPRPSSAPNAKASSLRSYQLKLSIRRIMSCSLLQNFFLGEVEIVFYPFPRSFTFFKIGYLIISSLLFRYSIFKDLSTLRHLKSSSDIWWAQMDSNHRPLGYQPSALTSWAISPFCHTVGGD